MKKSLEFVEGLDKIIILAQGPSWYQCPKEIPRGVEIWGSNVIYRDFPYVDRIFFGHDIRHAMLHDDIDLVENLNKLGVPVYTTGIFKVLKNNAQLPIIKIISEFSTGFFLNVIAYMLATAILQKPKCIEMYGVDMRPDAGSESYINEKGSVEFWCGVAIGRGIKLVNTKESYVMKTKQKGNFPNQKAKIHQSGLYTLIPKQDRNIEAMRGYMIVPDKNRKEI